MAAIRNQQLLAKKTAYSTGAVLCTLQDRQQSIGVNDDSDEDIPRGPILWIGYLLAFVALGVGAVVGFSKGRHQQTPAPGIVPPDEESTAEPEQRDSEKTKPHRASVGGA